ncbi:MAG TPA: DAK2 domain-containing protein [Acidimicrobiales bacterium]|nr:DAK2 domain-containing protein [Acidimicrobiales bacterium]
MTTLDRLGADDLRAVVVTYRDALRAHQEPINRLNVYPVPDGDTGTNMALTLEAVLGELDGADSDMASVCRAIAHGSLMGARGNSGVILCQILRGLVTTFADAEVVDGPTFARGLASATEGAYTAVGRPVEGTILTVVREAAEAAADAAGAGGATLKGVLEAALAGGSAALQRTPELLDVLRRAGVVDAGGTGFLLLLDAALCVVSARPLPEPPDAAVSGPALAAAGQDPAGADGVADLRYEVMFLLEAEDGAVDAFRDCWAGVGDSIVVVGGDGLWNCHIHTDDIGAAIEAGIDAGRPRQIRVTDLAGEVDEERWVREATSGHDADAAAPVTEVVAVASGDGLRALFETHGAGFVVSGGQSMNPSTAELLKAVETCRADHVVILPNNPNIVAVAEQVDGLSAKTVRVVPTTDINSGLAALVALDPRLDVEENVKAMASATEGLIAGEVTKAVRAFRSGAGHVAEGDWIGLGPAGIEASAGEVADAAIGLLDVLVGDGSELITLIEGEQARAEDTGRITAWLAEHRPHVEVEVHDGGQPLYPYLVGIE